MSGFKAQNFLTSACALFKLQTDVKVVEVSPDGARWTLSYKQDPEKPDFARNMMKLEALLQKKLRMPIELRLEATPDKMKRKERSPLGKLQEE